MRWSCNAKFIKALYVPVNLAKECLIMNFIVVHTKCKQVQRRIPEIVDDTRFLTGMLRMATVGL